MQHFHPNVPTASHSIWLDQISFKYHCWNAITHTKMGGADTEGDPDLEGVVVQRVRLAAEGHGALGVRIAVTRKAPRRWLRNREPSKTAPHFMQYNFVKCHDAFFTKKRALWRGKYPWPNKNILQRRKQGLLNLKMNIQTNIYFFYFRLFDIVIKNTQMLGPVQKKPKSKTLAGPSAPMALLTSTRGKLCK